MRSLTVLQLNILIDRTHTALVSDFGLSRAMDMVHSHHTNTSHRRRGTPRWMAPECMTGDPSTQMSDIWSLGLTIWEARLRHFLTATSPHKTHQVFSEVYPFEGLRTEVAIYNTISSTNLRPPRPTRLVQDDIWGLIESCWSADPSKRPGIAKVFATFEMHSQMRTSVQVT